MSLSSVLGTALALGLAIEVLVKFLRHDFDIHDRVPKAWFTAIAIALGLVSCYAFGINVFVGSSITSSKLSTLWGETLTGFTCGGGSGVIHGILAAWGGKSSNPKGLTPAA